MPMRKHLHIRGENGLACSALTVGLETPPHTWRKSTQIGSDVKTLRNTSTYVEKIGRIFIFKNLVKKHLHIRGENADH